MILAGGLGTRMWPVAKTVPKTMLPIAGRPFADWQLEWLAAAGVTSVVYCIGYLGEQVREHVGDGAQHGLSVSYVEEGDRLRGTAGALRLALDAGELDERFLVLYGDSWLQVDPAEVFAAARDSGLPALMTVYRNDGRFDASNVEFANGRVVRYEKGLGADTPDSMRWIDYGLSVFTHDVVEKRVPAGEVADLAPLCTALAAEGRLAGYLVNERFYEIGSPNGLAEAEALLSARRNG
ncbi:MAG TPA: sugar phosphate nucleotidyltransferase [Nocardioides sp.]|uniref:sugar phosphate nucleotidyltransferase n=1 Tax=Nocardioides sp. TaxID=35761 RepID=UPI002E2ECF39|nr:sugar phosphate nucleotidyltransferase [Nocardioides sp.]HEX5089862.1 sugar phosphate nucleotidyltransferase [Nocardioides sp.]